MARELASPARGRRDRGVAAAARGGGGARGGGARGGGRDQGPRDSGDRERSRRCPTQYLSDEGDHRLRRERPAVADGGRHLGPRGNPARPSRGTSACATRWHAPRDVVLSRCRSRVEAGIVMANRGGTGLQGGPLADLDDLLVQTGARVLPFTGGARPRRSRGIPALRERTAGRGAELRGLHDVRGGAGGKGGRCCSPATTLPGRT